MFEGLHVINIEGTKDPHDLNYATISTAERKRPNQIQDAIEHWNKECPASKIILQPVDPSCGSIETFGKSSDSSFHNHHIVKRILEDKAKKAAGSQSNYFSSNDMEIEEDPMLIHPDAMDNVPTTTGKRAAHTTSSAAAAKCSKTDEEIAAIIAEKDREIAQLREENNHLKQHFVEKLDKLADSMESSKEQIMDLVESKGEQCIKAVEKLDKLSDGMESSKEQIMVLVESKGEQCIKAVETTAACEQQCVERMDQALKTVHRLAQTGPGAATKAHNKELKARNEIHAKQIAEKDEIIKMALQLVDQTSFQLPDSADKDHWKGTVGYSQIGDFETTLYKYHLSKEPRTDRRDIPGFYANFDTTRRYLDLNIDVASMCLNDCSNNSGQHRVELGLITGPAIPAAAFHRMQNGLINQVMNLCGELDIPHPENLKVDYLPTENIFSRPEVSNFFLF
jgi:hypothetical protein